MAKDGTLNSVIARPMLVADAGHCQVDEDSAFRPRKASLWNCPMRSNDVALLQVVSTIRARESAAAAPV